MGAPDISYVSEWVREEEIEAGCCRYGGTDGKVLLRVWDTSDGSSFVQVLGTNDVVLRRRLAGGGTKPPEEAGKVGMTVEAFGGVGIA